MELEELETGSPVNTYETVVILNPEDYETSMEKICKLCQEFMGTKFRIVKEPRGIKELAYKIKDKYEKGYYLIVYWQGTPENITELERQMRIDDNVLKFMNLRVTDEADDIEFAEYKEEFAATEESEQDVSQDAWDVIFNN